MEERATAPPPTQAAVATYLAELASEMAEAGKQAELPFLAYLFGMAATEARTVVRRAARRRPVHRVPVRIEAGAAAAPPA